LGPYENTRPAWEATVFTWRAQTYDTFSQASFP